MMIQTIIQMIIQTKNSNDNSNDDEGGRSRYLNSLKWRRATCVFALAPQNGYKNCRLVSTRAVRLVRSNGMLIIYYTDPARTARRLPRKKKTDEEDSPERSTAATGPVRWKPEGRYAVVAVTCALELALKGRRTVNFARRRIFSTAITRVFGIYRDDTRSTKFVFELGEKAVVAVCAQESFPNNKLLKRNKWFL